mmetsp:Transcript_120677/g.341230  ORF Transcript_120677/g.341230 Transcript_120677/m.341230 type:complete len:214 (+) Transcript_120677:910-1551(+)
MLQQAREKPVSRVQFVLQCLEGVFPRTLPSRLVVVESRAKASIAMCRTVFHVRSAPDLQRPRCLSLRIFEVPGDGGNHVPDGQRLPDHLGCCHQGGRKNGDERMLPSRLAPTVVPEVHCAAVINFLRPAWRQWQLVRGTADNFQDLPIPASSATASLPEDPDKVLARDPIERGTRSATLSCKQRSVLRPLHRAMAVRLKAFTSRQQRRGSLHP